MRRLVTFVVRADESGQRLDSFLGQRLWSLSRTRIQQIILEDLGPDSPPLKAASLVHEGLRFSLFHEVADEPAPPELRVIYEDDAMMVIDKPGDLAIHPAGRHFRYTVTGALAAMRKERPDPAHRIDRETSGLLVCGKGKIATAALKLAFAEGRVEKTYLALCEGWPTAERFEVDLPLQLGSGAVRVRMDVGIGKPALTELVLQQRFSANDGTKVSLLRCHPKTGRQHQIRAHLAAIDLPVVGDKIYGPDETIFIRFTEGAMTPGDREKLRLDRHALHAARIVVPHPVLGTPLALESPLPRDLQDFVNGLRGV